MKKRILSLLATALLLLTGCHEEHNHEHEQDHPQPATVQDAHEHEVGTVEFTPEQAALANLTTERARADNFRSVIYTSGQLEPQPGDEQTIVATASGILLFEKPTLSEGTAVAKGERLATISSKNLQEGDPMIKAKHTYEAAQKELRRAEKLAADQIVSEKELEAARMRYEIAATAYQAQASSYTSRGVVITAPMGGYLKQRLAGQGDYVSMGQPIAVVAQNKRLQLRADLNQKYYAQLRTIESAHFRPAYSDHTFCVQEMEGRLLSTGKTASGGGFIPVTFDFANRGDLVPGAFCEVFLLGELRTNVISLPLAAITEEQGLHYIYIKEDQMHYRKQEVTLGESNGERQEILTGLSVGELVVVNGAIQLKLASNTGAIPAHTH